jgi:hypothetical protein
MGSVYYRAYHWVTTITQKAESMEAHDLDVEPNSGLHKPFTALFFITLFLIAIASLLSLMNGLDDFLHAPIGIKDHPPEPGALVQMADAAWLPLLGLLLLFGFLSLASRVFHPVSVMLATVILVTGSVALVGGILGESKKQYFQSQHYFTQTVTPVLYIVFLMTWVVVGVRLSIRNWLRERKPRYGAAAVLLLAALACALCGLYVGVVNTDKGVPTLMFGIPLAVAGFLVYPVKKSSTEPNA